MMTVLAWWLISLILAALAWPIAWRLLGRLPDRGAGHVRALGVLAGSYVFWLGGNFGWLPVDSGGAVMALLILAAASWTLARGQWPEMAAWLRGRLRYLITLEALFLGAFAVWAFVRANNPAITNTEKPMELAFLNAILRSDGFPPHDPWLSGYAISYYYFGYVMLAFLALLTGSSAGVAFNAGNALWFALVAVSCYSLVYNLLALRRRTAANPLAALLGPLFVLITGNLEALLDVMHARGLFWAPAGDGSLHSPFWRWVGLEELEFPPPSPPSWIPTRSSWWWWRASRVIRELDLQGKPIDLQAIDEFPFFSFLLADNHPHLLAMPFGLLAIALALQIFLRSGSHSAAWRLPFGARTRARASTALGLGGLLIAVVSLASALGGGVGVGEAIVGMVRGVAVYIALVALLVLVAGFAAGWGKGILTPGEFVSSAWIFGSLAFLNAWDFPIYLSLLLAVIAWQQRGQAMGKALGNLLLAGLGLVGAGVLFYLPWYPSFASQAAGILPHLLHPTRPLHFFIMFGVSFVPLAAWMAVRLSDGWRSRDWAWLLGFGLGLPAGLLVLALAYAGIIYLAIDPVSLGRAFSIMGVKSFGQAMASVLTLRLTASGTALILGMALAACLLLLRRRWEATEEQNPTVFILLLVIIGGLLVLGPEFFYLRDQFGLRMNTIFKFYFAAWILWGLAAAYAAAQLLERRGGRWIPVQILILLPLATGLLYPVLATWTKASGFNPPEGRTLDGALHPSYALPSDREAIRWMNANLEPGVVAEAIGGSYTYYGRVSVHTGFPTVLGWPGHESQWRGGAREMGNREADIRTLYQSTDWPETRAILETYGIRYVYVGELERSAYRPIFESKFDAFLERVFQNEAVAIYAMPEGGLP